MFLSNINASMKQNIVVVRILDAPIEQVWKAWADPALVQRWCGPEGYTSPSCQTDLREGGKYIFAMQAPPQQGSQISYTAGAYKKIKPNQHLEFTKFL